MPLTFQQIQTILQEKPRNRTAIQKAVRHESRLKLHCEVTVEKHSTSAAVTEFLDGFVKKLLPTDKYNMFCTLFRYPVDTVTLTERIFTALEKVFDGRNPVFAYEFLSDNDKEDWSEYRKGTLTNWKTEGFEKMKTAINSIVVVDLASEQNGQQPEPYSYFLDISQVVDFELQDGCDVFDWIIFHQPDNKIAVFDDETYRVFETKNGSIQELQPMPIIENRHDLGFSPARFFWTTPLSYNQKSIKKSPISVTLSKLDFLLFFSVSNEHLNLYGRYPIYSTFTSDCDYEHSETGEYCDTGYVKNRDGLHMIIEGGLKPCPLCNKRRLDGPGSIVEIDPPNAANDNADLRNPVSITTIDRNSLDYNNEDVTNRRNEIYAAVTGFQGAAINNKAVNEKQVIAMFESLEGALKTPQQNFEQIIKWTDETKCKLRYGSSSFVGANISLGTEHFIMSPSQLLEMYEMAKEASFSVTTLDMLEGRYYQTEYRNNPNQLQRQRIINNIDPFRHKSDKDVTAMFAANQIKYEDYLIKINLSSFITRFELENISIVEFGQGVNFETKINNIKAEFVRYANEMKPLEVIPETDISQTLNN